MDRIRFVSLPLVLAVAVCASGTDETHYTSGPLRGSLIHDRPVAIFSTDPKDSWNQINHLLFTNSRKVRISKEEPHAIPLPHWSTDPERFDALGGYYFKQFSGRNQDIQRLEGGDILELFFDEKVAFLLQDPRHEQVLNALQENISSPAIQDHSVVARVLFQHALWNRYDALYGFAQNTEDKKQKVRAERLLQLLGKWIAVVACKKEELESIPANLPEVAAAHPDMGLDLYTDDSSWREIIVPHNGEKTTSHAASAGFRKVFRVFANVPGKYGGPACLQVDLLNYFQRPRKPLESICIQNGHRLPPGSRAALVETMLGVADSGEILPAPLTLGLQFREVRYPEPGENKLYGLEDLPFQVLHYSRLALSSGNRDGGGLESLQPTELVPDFFSAFGRQGNSLTQMPLACINCHGVDGASLMSTNLLAVNEIQIVTADNTIQQDRVIAAKRNRPEFQSLVKFFAH